MLPSVIFQSCLRQTVAGLRCTCVVQTMATLVMLLMMPSLTSTLEGLIDERREKLGESERERVMVILSL